MKIAGIVRSGGRGLTRFAAVALALGGLSACQNAEQADLTGEDSGVRSGRFIRNGVANSDASVGMVFIPSTGDHCTGTTLCYQPAVAATRNTPARPAKAVVLTASHCKAELGAYYAPEKKIGGGAPPNTAEGKVTSIARVGSFTYEEATESLSVLGVEVTKGAAAKFPTKALEFDPAYLPIAGNNAVTVTGYGNSATASNNYLNGVSRLSGEMVVDSWNYYNGLLKISATPRRPGTPNGPNTPLPPVPCKGDSGAPVVYRGKVAAVIWGVYSLPRDANGNPVSEQESCRRAEFAAGMPVAPYFAEIQKAANAIVPGCIAPPRLTSPTVKVKAELQLLDPHSKDFAERSRRAPGKITLKTSPQGTKPRGIESEWRVQNGYASTGGAGTPTADYTYYPVTPAQTITFRAEIDGPLAQEITTGDWYINYRHFPGLRVDYPVWGVPVHAVFVAKFPPLPTPTPTPSPSPTPTPTPTPAVPEAPTQLVPF